MTNPITVLRLGVSLVRLVRDPNRLNEVFSLADALAAPEQMRVITGVLAQDPAGARALRERQRIGRVDLAALRALPEGTFGRAFADHMIANNLDPAALPDIASPDEGAFVRAHLYETHDIWHVVTGFDTDVAGELGLQAFYLAQFPAYLATVLISAGLLNATLYAFDDRAARMDAITRGWLLGKRTRPLFGTHWPSLWSVPLAEVRARFGIDAASAPAATEPARAAA
jgi:ubiquinone biosynthesis protein COQ4